MLQDTTYITSIKTNEDVSFKDEAFEEFKKHKLYDNTKKYVLVYSFQDCEWFVYQLL